MNPLAQNVMFGGLAFLVVWTVWKEIAQVLKRPSKPAPPPPPPERTLTQKDLEDILDMFIQYQGSVVTDVRTVEAPPVTIKEEEHNGHRELTEDDVLANLTPGLVAVAERAGLHVVAPEPKQQAKEKKKGKK